MKRVYRLLTVLILFAGAYPISAQQWVEFKFDAFQSIEVPTGTMSREIKFPERTFVLRSLDFNSLQHMGNSINVYGNMLIVDRMDRGPDGIVRLTLRREDGRNFFNLFPTVTGTIRPITNSAAETGKGEKQSQK